MQTASDRARSLVNYTLGVGVLLPAVALLSRAFTGDQGMTHAEKIRVGINVVVSVLAWALSRDLIPVVAKFTLRADLAGRDINKRPDAEGKKPLIPESLGLVPACMFLVCSILFQVYLTFDNAARLVEFNAGLVSICFMILLGFADDVLDLPWRVKLVLPALTSLPLLMAYTGSTTIVVPKPLRSMMGNTLNLGFFYQLYMCMLSIFTTNSINILAGINGLEAGQSLIIGISVAIHNLLELEGEYHDAHMFSLTLMIPFIAVTFALLAYNWYPSSVFVGDTYCYFAGVTFAVVGILGKFNKTLLLFFIPQILNFLYSIPQLVWLPCPRHRLPKLNPDTGKLEGIPTNLNLVNLVPCLLGPMTERRLCLVMLGFQILCCAGGFWVRYYLASFFYDT